jgi:hypothetical protein
MRINWLFEEVKRMNGWREGEANHEGIRWRGIKLWGEGRGRVTVEASLAEKDKKNRLDEKGRGWNDEVMK